MKNTRQGSTIAQTAKDLNVTPITVRRWIKQGKIEAQKIPGKYGAEYRVISIPDELVQPRAQTEPGQGYQALLSQIRDLSQELGYWKGRCEELQGQVKLLTAPKLPWYRRIWHK